MTRHDPVFAEWGRPWLPSPITPRTGPRVDPAPAFITDPVHVPGLTWQGLLDFMATQENTQWIWMGPPPRAALIGDRHDTSGYAEYQRTGHYPIPDSVQREIDRLTGQVTILPRWSDATPRAAPR